MAERGSGGRLGEEGILAPQRQTEQWPFNRAEPMEERFGKIEKVLQVNALETEAAHQILTVT